LCVCWMQVLRVAANAAPESPDKAATGGGNEAFARASKASKASKAASGEADDGATAVGPVKAKSAKAAKAKAAEGPSKKQVGFPGEALAG
jgi:hypothetical protein